MTQPMWQRQLAAPKEPAIVFAPGEVFAGRYRMVERIGSGGMGDVWRADDLVLETEVALKVIQSASPAARERIFTEVRLARQITHPGVCRVFDVGEAQGVIFFSMELHPRRGSLGAAPARGSAAAGEGHRHRPAIVRGPRGCSRARGPPSRPEACQYPHRQRRVRAHQRFRHCDSEDRGRSTLVHRHAGLHGARTANPRGWRCRSARTCTGWAGLYDLLLGGHVRHQAKSGTPLPPPIDVADKRRSAARSAHHGGALHGSG